MSISLSLNFRCKVYLGIILGILTNFFSGILVYHYPPLADPDPANRIKDQKCKTSIYCKKNLLASCLLLTNKPYNHADL